MTDYSSEDFWNGAPEGATGYLPESGAWYAVWVKEAGNIFFTWLASGDTEWDEDDTFDEVVKFLIRRPITPPWSGDGLPPVGTVCEVFMFGEWVQCEVVAHFMQSTAEVAAFTTMRPHGGKSLDSKIAECFRPIKTPAQIAAEEREKAIDEMHGLTNKSSNQEVIRAKRNVCAALYGAGYRKQEKPE